MAVFNGDAGGIITDDVVVLGGGNDVVNAGGGNNDVRTGGGNDRVNAGNGDDTIRTGKGDDIINAGGGDNWINAGRGNDIVNTHDGDDIIRTGKGDDRINAGGGDNVVRAGSGDNTVWTHGGDDRVFAGNGDDLIGTGAGDDIIKAGAGKNTVYAGAGSDDVYHQFGEEHSMLFGGHQGGPDTFILQLTQAEYDAMEAEILRVQDEIANGNQWIISDILNVTLSSFEDMRVEILDAPEEPPVEEENGKAEDDFLELTATQSGDVNLLANDDLGIEAGDTVTVTLIDTPAEGEVTVDNEGNLHWTPAYENVPGQERYVEPGVYTFTYEVSVNGEVSTAEVTVLIHPDSYSGYKNDVDEYGEFIDAEQLNKDGVDLVEYFTPLYDELYM